MARRITTRAKKESSLFSSAPPAPRFEEILSPEELFDQQALVKGLRRIDWGFTPDDTSFLSHDIHPYPAKFIPQIPGHLIARLSLRGDLVFDPFGGSGTTALEALRLGRRALVVDANPVGLLVGRVKTSRLTPEAETDVQSIRSAVLANAAALPSTSEMIGSYGSFVPEITHCSKWFSEVAVSELSLIRSYVSRLETPQGRDIASLAMSRIMLRASNQDSETRYAAKPRALARGDTLAMFVQALDNVVMDVRQTASELGHGVVEFVQADTRHLDCARFPDESVDLVVTSPPYGNSMDYHLYHRFRIFWLGGDPRALARIEVGSHLRHQKEVTGFETYRTEIGMCLNHIGRIVRAGRYVAIVIGDALYEGKTYNGASLIRDLAQDSGLEHLATIKRGIHQTKRSFVAAGRRATTESIVVLQRPSRRVSVRLAPPPYRLWPYEVELRNREVESLTGARLSARASDSTVKLDPWQITKLRRCAFTHWLEAVNGVREKTWQAILENGLASPNSARKDPKYATHGIHPYKGKFYPQLAKALINLAGLRPGSIVLDPFCGSGTTLLEAHLNGLAARGCDLHPLAAKIARAKVGVLDLEPTLVSDAINTLLHKLGHTQPTNTQHMDQFARETQNEIEAWFAPAIIAKLNWILAAIRSVSAGVLQDFFEVVLSSIVRDVSHQEPSDLRIRRRKSPLADANVVEMFSQSLGVQSARLERFWSIKGYCPYPFFLPQIAEGDARKWETLARAGLAKETVDAVITSPPYATALPYIDTDRLSLLMLMGLNASARRPLEEQLTGSREIKVGDRKELDLTFQDKTVVGLPASVVRFTRDLFSKMNQAPVGFRRKNMPALLLRYFTQMSEVMSNIVTALKPGAEAFVVMGDNATSAGAETIIIPTATLVADIAASTGLTCVERIPITVTTEDYVHVRNAIRENVVLRLRK